MNHKLHLSLATNLHRTEINRIRHDVYAKELGQFDTQPNEILTDRPGVESVYVSAFEDGKLVGFVGITPPTSPCYSVDHYLSRSDIPVTFDEHLYEIRALTVIHPVRGSLVAPALMYAAFRWIQTRGGQQLMAIGHRDVVGMYQRLGMKLANQPFQSGHLEYELLTAPTHAVETVLARFESRLERLEKQVEWQLDTSFRNSTECYHGGAFFNAIGNQFDDLTRRNDIINADVLDAWFPPCPSAKKALSDHLDWIMRTSPPNHAEGLVQTIAETRGVAPENILTGGGSSPLIFMAFRQWLKPSSRVLLLDPTYGEYAHVLEKVVGCKVERFKLNRAEGYQLNVELLSHKLTENFDLFVWVNPNSPTGKHISRKEVDKLLSQAPPPTRIWIDETYVEYAGREQSLEPFAAQNTNTVVCKSMSKVYGLSGLRIGYLCGSPGALEPLRALTPPWSVSLPAQVAAVQALQSPDYYETRYQETHALRDQLTRGLQRVGIREIIPGIANFILFHLRDDHPDSATIINRCQEKGLFIRDAAEMGSGMGNRAIRVAVKDSETNQRILRILKTALSC